MNKLVNACLEGNYGEALSLQKKYYPLMKTLMTLDGNPVTIKAAMAIKGSMTGEIRLPLVELSEDKKKILSGVLSQFELN